LYGHTTYYTYLYYYSLDDIQCSSGVGIIFSKTNKCIKEYVMSLGCLFTWHVINIKIQHI